MRGIRNALSKKSKTKTSVEEIFRCAANGFQRVANLPPDQRTPASILRALDLISSSLLDCGGHRRFRKHIETLLRHGDIGKFCQLA